jgi:ABC-type lipoprotein release transport system permease subunit
MYTAYKEFMSLNKSKMLFSHEKYKKNQVKETNKDFFVTNKVFIISYTIYKYILYIILFSIYIMCLFTIYNYMYINILKAQKSY